MASIDIVKNLGLDAQNNLWDIEIPTVPGITGIDELKFRINSVSIPPTPEPNKYQVFYKTQSIEKLGSQFQNEFEFTMEIRIDREQFVYDFFRLWRQLGINTLTGIIDESLIPKVPVVVRSTDSGDTGTGFLSTFQNAYPVRIEGFDYSREGGDPLVRSVAMHFDLMDTTVRG